ncbi:zinc finger BED domain-containing protein RICESLEEPER 2 [Artemisia annua]|uniref:Zinc finger BED domain-containing protein RICESLEEPER 2 n=1 Tax=Artemisia annua TaxID=35608 RepID=A0A2U1PZE4_ARTAN|nr:zinc finger BED domain-containing protein RICESLEEPER 2 [Artemisia annua]
MEEDQFECDNNVKKRKAPAKPRRTTAACWNCFVPKMEQDENGNIIKFAYCKWCPVVIKADSRLHAFKKKMGDNNEGVSSIGTLETWKYDEKDIKKALLELVVLAELPFKFVEHPAFIKFAAKMQPKFNVPSRFTIARDISKFYIEERKSLLNYLSNKATTVHLTTDTWTSSCKRMNFMVLTAHFIDDDWRVLKRLDIDKHLREWQHENASFKEMIEDMRKKYDKYWGDYKKINHYMYFAMILDPTMKLEMIGVGFRHLIENGCVPMEVDKNDSDETPLSFLTDGEVCDKMVKKVENDMRVLFDIYKEKYGTNLSTGNKFSGVDDELTKYLKEPRLELEGDDYFDILNWWKLNSPRFPIVSKMAKEELDKQKGEHGKDKNVAP